MYISRYEGPGAADAQKLLAAVETFLDSDEFKQRCLDPLVKKLDSSISDCIAYVEQSAKESVADAIVGTAQRMAEEFIDAIVMGDEDAAKRAFGFSTYVPSEWAIMDCGFNETRRKLVEAHADLLRSEYAADLEKTIVALRAEIARQSTQITRLIKEQQ